jgi:hypothetical protein
VTILRTQLRRCNGIKWLTRQARTQHEITSGSVFRGRKEDVSYSTSSPCARKGPITTSTRAPGFTSLCWFAKTIQYVRPS